MKKLLLLTLLTFLISTIAFGQQLRVPTLFSSDMVLQQNSELTLWGWANRNDEVTISTSWDHKEITTKTSATEAIWKTAINTPSAGGPYTITIKTKSQQILLENVLIGEVWLCSGQSNMEWSASKGIIDSLTEVSNANNPNIRMFNVQKATYNYPLNNCTGTWKSCTPEIMGTFSAVGYFFGRRLNENLNVPIGLINASWGGTPIEVWMKGDLIEKDSLLLSDAYKNTKAWSPIKPGATYNTMIYPLTGFPIAGVIWYQGESNVQHHPTYSRLFKMMVENWRSDWKKELPFYTVQIAPHSYKWQFENLFLAAYLREQQTQCMQIPNTDMIVTTDLVTDTTDIHPRNKKDVGIRLANLALTDTYHKSGINSKFPKYKSLSMEKGKIRISFDNAPNGLKCNGKELTEFCIAGSDKVFHKATAKIDKNTVVVSCKEVKNPVAVRFAFRNSPLPNLFSIEGLPVIPFRTDNW
jgi:sialate O-acetylesterase